MDGGHHQISISSGTIIKVFVIAAAAYALWQLSVLVLILLSAIVIASAVDPGVEFFVKRKLPRAFGVVTVFASMIAVLAALVWFFVPPLLDELLALLAVLPQYVTQVESFSLPFLEGVGVGPTLAENILQLQSTFADTGAGVLQLIASFFGGAFYFILTIVLAIYFSFKDTGVDDFLRIVTPASHRDYVLSLWRRSHKKIGLWMQGQLLLSLIITILLYLGLSLLGVPYALLLAIFAGVMELIPVFGSIVAAVPGIIMTLLTGDLTLTLIVAGFYLFVNQFQANLIYPLVVQKVVGVAPILVIIALIAGGQLAGFMGVLLSVPVAAVIQELVHDIEKRRAAS